MINEQEIPNEEISDYLNLQKFKPIKNKRTKKLVMPKPKKDEVKNDPIDSINKKIQILESKVDKLEKLTKYLDYVRSINTTKK